MYDSFILVGLLLKVCEDEGIDGWVNVNLGVGEGRPNIIIIFSTGTKKFVIWGRRERMGFCSENIVRRRVKIY